MTVFYASLNSPLGPLTVFEEAGAITVLEWGHAPGSRSSPLINQATRQLTEYFDGMRRDFDLPLNPAGTPFRKSIWAAMQKIPYGETWTYGELAQAAGAKPGAGRATGAACGANPTPILIPCHRVVGTNGALTGYSGGEGIETKKILLRLEGARLI